MRESLVLPRGAFGVAAIACLPSQRCENRQDHVLETHVVLWLRHDPDQVLVKSFRTRTALLACEGPVPDPGPALRTSALRWIENRVFVRSGSNCDLDPGEEPAAAGDNGGQLTRALFLASVEAPPL